MANASWKTCGLPTIEPHKHSSEVLVTWIPRWNKKLRLVSTAVYIPYHHCTTDDMGWNTDNFLDLDYCEEQDSWWIPSGWYETTMNTIDDTSYVLIDGEVIAWDNMPKPYRERLTDMRNIEQINGEVKSERGCGMLEYNVIQKLMDCFPGSVIKNGEFIAHIEASEYFILKDCETELDIKCKVIECFSRGAFKTEPYEDKQKDDKFHKFMRDGINKFLGTDFDKENIEVIYTYLGNRCSHKKTLRFIESNYDFSVLRKKGV